MNEKYEFHRQRQIISDQKYSNILFIHNWALSFQDIFLVCKIDYLENSPIISLSPGKLLYNVIARE